MLKHGGGKKNLLSNDCSQELFTLFFAQLARSNLQPFAECSPRLAGPLLTQADPEQDRFPKSIQSFPQTLVGVRVCLRVRSIVF